MTGNRMAHPLLISLANIDADIRSKESLHAHILLTLLPVVSFLHLKTRVRSLLSDRLIHESHQEKQYLSYIVLHALNMPYVPIRKLQASICLYNILK